MTRPSPVHPFRPLAGLALLASLALLGAAPRDGGLPHTYQFPIIGRAARGFTGLVTEGGVPAVGAWINLRRWDPGSYGWSDEAGIQTDSQGRYYFENLGSLGPGELYDVIYEFTTPSQVGWGAPVIEHYSAGSLVVLPTFDLAGVDDIAPAPDAFITLPYTFQWTARQTTPQDHYTVWFSGTWPYFNSGDLGHASSFTLKSLPAGSQFGPANPYYWQIAIAWADGSGGEQYSARRVYFNNAGASPSPALYFGRFAPR